jgi:imidazole glycerol phosphate synthase glutamine amidotransferase subunit
VITVIDYGMGNLRNVRRAFEELGESVTVTSSPEDVQKAERLVLPGVGAFGEAVRRIDALSLRKPILGHVMNEKPLLGVCLGMQLLFGASDEAPGARGLGLLPGVVVRFGPGVKVPHIGWNDAHPTGKSVLFGQELTGGCYYFVHSYCVRNSEATVARTDYGGSFSSAVESGQVFGVQFHPEKSQVAGMALLRQFLAVPSKA